MAPSPATKTALLVIDMQNYFLPMTTTALPNIVKLSAFFSAHDLPQIFTQHGHPPSDFTPPITNQLVRKWGSGGSVHAGTPEWELIPSIQELVTKDTPIIHKNVYDAFLYSDLEEQLKSRGVVRVVITGVMTDCCCDTTGRSAFNRGFETWMVGDGTGSAGKGQHERGLKAWSFGYGEVIDTEEVMHRLE
ncbi:Isochorismatase-like protein [Clohesyomyces aquaticus]|uniref:Isochorismatase-like protein n=1 Tax=Clohesyomyces aquaticus TaxID=1231657 RepID=A0A1Y1ZL41_9PLEO|nr:Isochorismatase-like protein [Clohesyomyces aquaticus]